MFSKGPEHYLSPLRREDFGGSFRFQAERIGDQSLLTEFFKGGTLKHYREFRKGGMRKILV